MAATRAFRSSWLAVSFAFVALAFLASSVLAQWTARRVAEHARSLQTNALPSIEQLTAARSDLRRVASTAQRGNVRSTDFVEPVHDLDQHLDSYLALESYPGEREVFDGAVRPSLASVRQALERLIETPSPTPAAPPPAVGDVLRAVDSADDSLRHLILFNSAQATSLSSDILATRGRALRMAAALDAGSAALAVLAAVLAVRMVRRHTLALQARADELDAFASRVAHDLMSPLAAVHLSLAAVERRHSDEETRRDVARAARSLDRSRLVVGSIYEFARSGGKVPAGARAPVFPVLQAAADALLASESNGAKRPEITVEGCESCEVACDPGVFAIMVSNLLSNAAKFTADSPVRRVWVRCVASAERVRVEVEDTGPGLPRGLEKSVFEPHVRAPGVTQPGLGLGLATVKRYATACSGTVGVGPAPRGGSVFWFELPRATVAERTERAGSSGRPGREVPA